jgi:Trypsin-like peptidase domain
MTEEDLRRSVLKVVSPYEGSAFVAAPGFAVSCIHVCVRDRARKDTSQPVEFEYLPDGATTPVKFGGSYLPNESDPRRDVAVIELALPPGLVIPSVPLSLDDQPEAEVVALGVPAGQRALRDVPGVVFKHFRVRQVTFTDGTELEVLHIGTGGKGGFWADGVVRSGMSGGPIFNVRTGTVVAIVEGKRPRGSLDGPPEGYGIELKHLLACSASLRGLIDQSVGRRRLRRRIAVAIALIVGLIAGAGYWVFRPIPSPTRPEGPPPPKIGLAPLVKAAVLKADRAGNGIDLSTCENLAAPCDVASFNANGNLVLQLDAHGHYAVYVLDPANIATRQGVAGEGTQATVPIFFGGTGLFKVVVWTDTKPIVENEATGMPDGRPKVFALFTVQ